ncbi:AbrB/MazE/SpoVT family DNA-binding domain-containing protein [Thermoproteota archaeon]
MKCFNCNSNVNAKRQVFNIMGFKVRGWKCPKCGEEYYEGDDINKVLVYNKLKKGIPVKVGALGNSLVMRLPKEVSSVFDIKKGQEVVLRVKDKELVVGF